MAFSFGLLHGFGFAGALTQIGLPQGDILLALFAFNVGVEVGQLIFIAAVLGVLAAARRFKPAPIVERRALFASTYVIGALAGFWFIERGTDWMKIEWQRLRAGFIQFVTSGVFTRMKSR